MNICQSSLDGREVYNIFMKMSKHNCVGYENVEIVGI